MLDKNKTFGELRLDIMKVLVELDDESAYVHRFAYDSFQKVWNATSREELEEIVPIIDNNQNELAKKLKHLRIIG